jgi:hypothetical protein
MIQPHEIFPGAWLLDHNGKPFEVESFCKKPTFDDGRYNVVNDVIRLSECSPIELTYKIVNDLDINSVTPKHIYVWMAGKECEVENTDLDRAEFSTTHLHNLQAFFNLHYTPITINEQQLREAIK